MRVRFIGMMPTQGYSGGRLLSICLAESLATSNVDVDYCTNHIPEMYAEFKGFSKVKFKVCDLNNLSSLSDDNIDVVIIIPHQGGVSLHGEWTRHAIECHAKIVLLNFESPNWFNALSPVKRDPILWSGWDIVSEFSDCILSISSEGNRYASEYYKYVKSNCVFQFCYTAINSIAADSAPEQKMRDKTITVLTRVDPHKGFDSLEPLIDNSLRGYEVKIFLGNGSISSEKQIEWAKKFDRVGIRLSISSAIKGVEKFTLLKKSSLLYFPTRFEGFGIPPLEAAYCKLPTACSDLPVLREFGGTALTYADPSSPKEMLSAIHTALADNERVLENHSRISEIARMDACGFRLKNILSGLF
jgi:hypothetical protein